jgi:phosphoribosylaminoimidazolecarboxamide formyltransferase/IMP cyclohydrolase
MRIERALLSVSDKDGIQAFAARLSAAGVELVSTGGTARALREAGLTVRDVSELTGSPEMMEGRVKTLHPRVHGGILARRDHAGDVEDMRTHGIAGIDLVVVNLYPFEQTVAREGVTVAEAVEQIDIGGPTMVRAAAKNHAHVGIVVDPDDYERVASAVESGAGLDEETRRDLALKAFASTARYDAAIVRHFAGLNGGFPEALRLGWDKVADLRYGENPHQSAAFYRSALDPVHGLAAAVQHQGKELSYNNLVDADAAYALARDLSSPGVAVIKHTNPCGVGVDGESATLAYERALEGDPISAFGGIVAVNVPVDQALAERLVEIFLEIVIAPSYTPEALEILAAKKNLRALSLPLEQAAPRGPRLQDVAGGVLVQERDAQLLPIREARVVTERSPTESEWRALELAWVVSKHVKSNTIVYANAVQAAGIGAGQMSRVDAARLAATRARIPTEGGAAGSDAFFPFRDGLDVIAEAGITAVVQPGGSRRDDEVIAAANEHGMAMVLTGERHFRH